MGCRANDSENWHKLFQKLNMIIGFTIDVNGFPLKSRYRRRVWRRGSRRGWGTLATGTSERGPLWAGGGRFRVQLRTPGRGGGESAGRPTDRVAITAPVMKGLRGGEEKVQQVVIIVHCMLQRISKYSQKVCVY